MTSKIIPFRKADKSLQKKKLVAKLKDFPDDFLTLGELIKLSITEDEFNPNDKSVVKFIESIPTTEISKIDTFLFSIAKIINSIDWQSKVKAKQYAIKLNKKEQAWGASIKEEITRYDKIQRIKEEILSAFGLDDFEKDRPTYIDDPYDSQNNKKDDKKELSKIKKDSSALKNFFIRVLKTVLESKGITEGLAYAYADSFHYWDIPTFKINSEGKSHEIKQKRLAALLEEVQVKKWEKETAKEKPDDMVSLFRLLEYKYERNEDTGKICKAILRAIPNTSIEELDDIHASFVSEGTTLFHSLKDIEFEDDEDDNFRNFKEAFYQAVYKAGKYNYQIAFDAGCFLSPYYIDRERDCPPEFMFPVCTTTRSPESTEDLFITGKMFLARNKAKEAMYCFKRSFLDNIFTNALNLSDEDREKVIEAIRRTRDYKRMIKFLSIFPALIEHGWQANEKFLGSLEEIKARLEIEYRAYHAHRIDGFYEIVAKEDYPALLKDLGADKNEEIILTKEQLHCIIEKINEKASIIKGFKAISAKIDLMSMNQKVMFEKSGIIFEAVKEGKEEILKTMGKNVDTIIDSIHRKNLESFRDDIMKNAEEYYNKHMPQKLWEILDNQTKKFLCLAQYLYESNKWSTKVDEFGFVAIEYSKALENEFCRKVIDEVINEYGNLTLDFSGKPMVINKGKPIAFGQIPHILNCCRKGNNKLRSFLKDKTIGGENIIHQHTADLFLIRDKYRNPAAHPYPYERTLVDEFRGLLFDKGFLAKFLSDIQRKRK